MANPMLGCVFLGGAALVYGALVCWVAWLVARGKRTHKSGWEVQRN